MKQYKELLQRVVNEGTNKPNRTGEDTKALFHHSYTIDLREGFPLLTGKKINFNNILFEMLWFLGGDNKVDFLHKHRISFWDQWIEDGQYLPEAYGKYWRKYPEERLTCFQGNKETSFRESPEGDIIEINGLGYVQRAQAFDQFKAILNELKTNPNSRRMVLTNWYPPSAWSAKLPPCHLMCIFNVQYEDDQPYLNLEMLQRSCDVPVGVPFNIASYALLLELVGNMAELPVRYFGHTLVDVHIYNNQMEGVKTYLSRELHDLPQLKINEKLTLGRLDDLIKNGTTEEIKQVFEITNYNPHPYIKFEVMV